MAFNFKQFEKSGKDKKEDKAGAKPKKFAAGGLAKTQSNMKNFGRGIAKVMNQKSGGKMAKGGKVKGC